MFSRFIHVVACVGISFLFMAESYSTVWVAHCVYPSLSRWASSCLPFLACTCASALPSVQERVESGEPAGSRQRHGRSPSRAALPPRDPLYFPYKTNENINQGSNHQAYSPIPSWGDRRGKHCSSAFHCQWVEGYQGC